MTASIARRYARALLQVAAPKGEADAVAQQLDELAAAYAASAELRAVLADPAFDRARRHHVIGALCAAQGLSETVANLAKLLVDKHRFRQLPAIAASYRELADELAGRARAKVATAAPLPADLAPKLEHALSTALSKKVLIETHVQPALLGGAVAQVGSLLFDGSVRTQLESLRRSLKAS